MTKSPAFLTSSNMSKKDRSIEKWSINTSHQENVHFVCKSFNAATSIVVLIIRHSYSSALQHETQQIIQNKILQMHKIL